MTCELLCTADADFELEPVVGLWVYHNEKGGFWLSWDDTCKLAELLRSVPTLTEETRS